MTRRRGEDDVSGRVNCQGLRKLSLSLSEGWMKKSIVLIPLPSLIKKSFVRSLVCGIVVFICVCSIARTGC